ncbi:transposase [Pseudomarimonas salicorniae]|uniref:Transposase n=1 Tax=Pseudomarimonas salicorniae TaxID=2933270 RepID=A0ABT0GCP0_9GAMM|nr:transposase [Lysobacter sp. CAU 1642]MCK7592294.1 transposase [Lysobacter sp. CAU 1642]
MGYPRSQLVSPGVAGAFHCVSRCVRRAFLCGSDPLSGRSFDHRKDWIEARLLELAGIFSISVLAYAVMSNHVHVVLRVDPENADGWTDDEVAARWVRLFPARVDGEIDAEACRRKAWMLTGNAERMAVLRQRLADLSWFMRCLSEPLARLANGEDRCTGRFWEGRFRCQALLDDEAVLACMAYVDLNPVRAGLAEDLAGSKHTSIHRRLSAHATAQAQPLREVAGPAAIGFLPISEADYIRLVDWAGRQLNPGKRGMIASNAPPALPGHIEAEKWLDKVSGIESRFCRAIGSAQALLDKAQEIGQRWLMVRRVARQPM